MSRKEKFLEIYPNPKNIVDMDEKEALLFYANVRVNFAFFCYYVLGYHDMNDEHFALCDFLQDSRRKFKLILMPRYTFKSCLITQGYSLWKLIKNPDSRIMIYSDAHSKAQGFLSGIKNHIEGKMGRSRFREFYPKWEVNPHKDKWNESQINVSVRKQGSVESNIDTGGIESSKTGFHYEIVFFDDIVSDLNVTTKAQMDKVHECYRKALSLLIPNGDIVMVGTRWHFNDLYGRIIAENKEKDIFDIFIRQAIVGGKYMFDNIGGSSLTKAFLDRQKAEQGSYTWSCLYQNSPVSDEQAIFKHDDFHFYGELKKSQNTQRDGMYENLYVTGTLDPAGEGEDDTAGTVVGADSSLRVYVLELFSKVGCSVSEMVDWIIKMNNKYHFRKFGIETTFFRGMLKKEVEERIRKEQTTNVGFNSFGIEELKTRWRKGEGKRFRIDALQPFHERGDLLFPGNSVENLKGHFGDLAYQMTQVTHDHMPEPNGLIDALSWQVEMVQRGGMPEQAGVPKYSPAWLEEQWIENFDRMQKRLPRHKRRIYEPSLS